MEIGRDIIASIEASLIEQAVILVIIDRTSCDISDNVCQDIYKQIL